MGNLSSVPEVNYTYDTNHKHAVAAMSSGESYVYDANGNQTQRVVGGNTYNLTFDAENHLVGVSGAVTATFVYDGDGNRVKATIGTTTTYVGNYFEWTGSTSTMKKYYYAGSIKVAMRTGSPINYLLGDHLGSNAITTSSSGVKNSEIRYMPWGTTRYTYGSSPTTFQYTGQRIESSLGLLFYNARWYDSALGRFIQADTIVPGAGNPQAFDRYAYSYNNPVKYIDPIGHWPELSDIFSIGATICDITATAVSVAGIAVEAFAAAGGELLSPIPGVDGAAGLVAGIGFYNTVLNPIENGLSLASLALVSASDIIAGNDQVSRITDYKSGQQATELKLGADTTFSLGSVLVGNTPLTPDAVSDTIANIATVYYDVKRLNNEEPIWGLQRLDFVQPDNSRGYIEIKRYHEENHGR